MVSFKTLALSCGSSSASSLSSLCHASLLRWMRGRRGNKEQDKGYFYGADELSWGYGELLGNLGSALFFQSLYNAHYERKTRAGLRSVWKSLLSAMQYAVNSLLPAPMGQARVQPVHTPNLYLSFCTCLTQQAAHLLLLRPWCVFGDYFTTLKP